MDRPAERTARRPFLPGTASGSRRFRLHRLLFFLFGKILCFFPRRSNGYGKYNGDEQKGSAHNKGNNKGLVKSLKDGPLHKGCILSD